MGLGGISTNARKRKNCSTIDDESRKSRVILGNRTETYTLAGEMNYPIPLSFCRLFIGASSLLKSILSRRYLVKDINGGGIKSLLRNDLRISWLTVVKIYMTAARTNRKDDKSQGRQKGITRFYVNEWTEREEIQRRM